MFRQGSGGQLQLIIFLCACKLFGLRTREDYHLLTLDQFFLERTEMEDLSCLLDDLPRLIIKKSQASLLFRARVSNTIQNLRSDIPLFFSLPRKVSLVEYNLHYQDEVNSPFCIQGIGASLICFMFIWKLWTRKGRFIGGLYHQKEARKFTLLSRLLKLTNLNILWK